MLRFERNYIQPQKFDRWHLAFWQDIYVLLQRIAYDEFFDISNEDFEDMLLKAEDFLDAATEYINDYDIFAEEEAI